ncbi:MAG: ferrous iron transporter B [Planctomycetota bacterium]
MTSAPVQSEQAAAAPDRRVALLGNPNVGKTTLVNRLSRAGHKTANFPGTTQEALVGRAQIAGRNSTLIDLPGIYALDLNLSESSVCRAVLAGHLAPEGLAPRVPDVLLVVLDATNMLRNLALLAEAARLGLPTGVVVNRLDEARRRGIHVDVERLAERIGCPAIGISARTGEGLAELPSLVEGARPPGLETPPDRDAIEAWADDVYAAVAAPRETPASDRLTDRLDRAFTHPVLGVGAFALVMTGLFWVIFRLAAFPMDWIDLVFAHLGGLVESSLPPGAVRDLLSEGVVAGIGGTVIFLPQICLLFFLIALLESTGYLARAAFVIDRLMRPFGLSGHAFVPLLSSHACALPGIMACRAIPDRRDRLATILVAPFMSCSARIPVYVLLTVILFPGSPGLQALAFTGCYVVGAGAGVLSALIARRTFLRGRSRPMALELPPYRLPDVAHALRVMLDRGWVFLKKAGTVILGISIVLWWLGAYPGAGPSPEGEALRAQATSMTDGDARALFEEADALDAGYAARTSFLGRIGETVQPVFEPLGYDRQLTVGVLASFAAREVFATTMAVQVAGSEDIEDQGVVGAIASARRDDGSAIFSTATSWSLLIYYILAMQCLPTLVVTAREAGGWKWAGAQLAWMSGLAYVCALLVYQGARLLGAG